MKELFEIAEQLEARFQDELDNVRPLEVQEQVEEEFYSVSADVVTVHRKDGEADSIVLDGLIFGKLCNEPVDMLYPEEKPTFCIKAWGHTSVEHEDQNGVVHL